MSFLYPSFLFALFALSIPVIIHFFNLQKPKEVLFTNVKFLKHIQEITSSKLKIKHWLVLLSRLLVLLFLILAFAQPVIIDKHLNEVKSANSVAIYIDNSLSMSNQSGDLKSLDEGLQYVTSLSEMFKPSTNYLFLTNDFEGKDFTFRNSDKIQERITEINYSPLHRSVSDVGLRFTSILNKNQENNQSIFFVSDFQKSTSGDLSKLELDSTSNYFFLPITHTNTSNVFIDSVWLDEPLLRLNTIAKLKVRVQNASQESISNVNLKLYLNDVQFSNASVSLEASDESIVEFSFSVKDTTTHKGVVQVEDNTLTFDNQYYFVLDVSSKIHIYNIYQENSGSIDNVFGNHTIFDLSNAEVGNVNYSDWESYDLIVLNGIDDIKEPLLIALKTYLKQGGSVVLIAGKKPVLVTYTNLVNGMAFSSVNTETEDKKSFELVKPDIRNPFFKDVFEKEERNLVLPYAYPTVKPAYRGNELLIFKNNLSFLSSYQSMDQGKIYLFTSPMDASHTDFDKHALFVPVMYKIAFSSFKKYPHLAYTFDQKLIEVPIENEEKNAIFTLEQGDFKVIPQQKISQDALTFELHEQGLKSGFYNLKAKNTNKLIAFNAGHAESLMEFYTNEELKTTFAGNRNVQVLEAEDFDDFKSTFKNQYIGTPLWKYCLILALFFLLSEILLLRFL